MTVNQDGRIVSLQLCVGHRKPMLKVKSSKLITGFGIDGDRHASSEERRIRRQVLLMDDETLQQFGLAHGEIRENVTISGVDFTSLSEGVKVALGDDVLLDITGDCDPCPRMDEIRSGLQDELQGQRGLLCYVTQGGDIRIGDAVKVLDSSS